MKNFIVIAICFILMLGTGLSTQYQRTAEDNQRPSPRSRSIVPTATPDPAPPESTPPSYIDGPPGMPEWMEDWNPWDQWTFYIQSMMYHYYFGGQSVFSSLN